MGQMGWNEGIWERGGRRGPAHQERPQGVDQRVRPRQGVSLPFVLHPPVLEPHLEKRREGRIVRGVFSIQSNTIDRNQGYGQGQAQGQGFLLIPVGGLISLPSKNSKAETDMLSSCLSVRSSTILPAHRISRKKATLLKRQVAAFTRPRLAFLLFHKRPSGS